jgi:hypothetical protein
MTRLLAALVGVAAVVSLGPAAPVPAHLMPKDPPLAFPTSVGTTWVYECASGSATIVISDVTVQDGAKLVTTEWVGENGARTPHMVTRVSTEGVFLVSESGEKYDEPWCIVKLPHRAGQEWETRVRGRGFKIDGKMTAAPMQKVRVPAGEFTAAPVEWEVSPNSGKTTNWYAHGVGLVRLNEQMKLKSFTPGK